MIITLDGDRVSNPAADCTTLESVIERTSSVLGPQRMLVAVRLNGRLLDEAGLDESLQRTLGATDQVDLESGTRSEVVAGALRSLADTFRDASDTVGEVSQKLNTGEIESAMHEVAAFIQLWQNCRTALVQGSTVLARDLTGEPLDGRPLSDRFGELSARLAELRDALQSRDFVLVSDLLFYEMPAICGEWSDLLRRLAESVEADAG